ncbi:MAG: 23S rRNA (guanosine(2251)-2'-O)-methyltransferase RlmB [Treponema sp.]|jgi:23S rRNA (guanosine2251-2'-O)-methyltransferase|nr:23S rRNA (guanosine(2251)-2'-O)-methyltransferase RlmB [Treponema sp.]
MTYITGFHAIEETILSGARCGPLLSAKAGPRARELAKLAQSRKIRIDRVGSAELDRLAPGHRGIALETPAGSIGGPGEEVAAASLDDYLASLGDRRDALVLMLDEVTDPHNYGAILRSCDQFAVDLVISRRRRSAKHAAVIAQTSAGASAWVRNAEEPNLVRAMDALKDRGFWIYCAGMEGEAVYSLDMRGRICLVMGGEAGISRLLRERCDGTAAVPCRGRIDSLNVSVAAGILLYEVSRQRAQKKPPRGKLGE